MLKLRMFGTILAIIIVVLSGYGLISGSSELMPYIILFLSIMLLTIGIVNIKDNLKLIGIASIIVSIFIFLFSIKNLFFK